MYGLNNITVELLNNYAQRYLKDESNVQNTMSLVLGNKVANAVSEKVSVTVKEVTLEEYNSIIISENKENK